MYKVFLFILTTSILTACDKGSVPSDISKEHKSVTPSEDGKNTQNVTERRDYKFKADTGPSYYATGSAQYNQANQIQLDIIQDRKLIWNAHLKFQVKNINQSTNAIRKLSKQHAGYISDMIHVQNDNKTTANITIRVASAHFHDLVQEIKGESAHLDIANINSEDVSEEYVDIENRLKTKRTARDRYIEILRTKTGTIEEVINAEDAIRRITEEIEAKEGRLRYLQDQLDFSSITLEIYDKTSTSIATAEPPTYGDKAKDSFSKGWNFIKGFGLVLVGMWPLLLILAIVAYVKRDWIRQKVVRSKKNS